MAAASRARLKVASDQMELSARHAAIVALRMVEIFFSFAVGDAVVFLASNRKPHRLDLRSLVAVPTRL